MLTLILATVCLIVILCFFGIWLYIGLAWQYGGEFYISENKGRRKTWFERLLDGLEIVINF